MRKIISSRLASLLMVLATLALPIVTLAIDLPEDLEDAFTDIVGPVFMIILAIALIFILYAAYTFVTSGGDVAKVESARNTLVYGIVGILLAFIAYAIYKAFIEM
jgi:hypothetical protein